MSRDRDTRIVGTLLDWDASVALIERHREGWRPYSPLLRMPTLKDQRTVLAVINTEGVGCQADGDTIGIHVVAGPYGGYVDVVEVPVAEVEAIDGTELPLASHVRTFGDRLESNFRLWARRAHRSTIKGGAES